jgi:hypothetical protein
LQVKRLLQTPTYKFCPLRGRLETILGIKLVVIKELELLGFAVRVAVAASLLLSTLLEIGCIPLLDFDRDRPSVCS